jgi:hypothetical protein
LIEGSTDENVKDVSFHTPPMWIPKFNVDVAFDENDNAVGIDICSRDHTCSFVRTSSILSDDVLFFL